MAPFDLLFMRSHFGPFTEVLGRIWQFVTRKDAEDFEPRITRMSRIRFKQKETKTAKILPVDQRSCFSCGDLPNRIAK